MFIARKQIGCEDFTGKAGGEGITIAVLDTGISTHPDFGGRILAFRDFVNMYMTTADTAPTCAGLLRETVCFRGADTGAWRRGRAWLWERS